MKPHVFHPAADEEYTGSATHYAGISPELGARFYDEIERVTGSIRAHPLAYRAFDPPARRSIARGFPYAVVYLDEPNVVWIVAVMHLKRRPAYWKNRLA